MVLTKVNLAYITQINIGKVLNSYKTLQNVLLQTEGRREHRAEGREQRADLHWREVNSDKSTLKERRQATKAITTVPIIRTICRLGREGSIQTRRGRPR